MQTQANALCRRSFLSFSAKCSLALLAAGHAALLTRAALPGLRRVGGPKLKLSLNAYSFNQPLMAGTMSLDQLLEFCAQQQLDAVDITGYYFKGYPEVPSDPVINSFKRRASVLGLDISGTGVRNDFTQADESARRADIELVKRWVVVAGKLGAPTLRVFAGKETPAGVTRVQASEWLVSCLEECVQFAEKHGVIIAVQNHNDFIATAAHAREVLDKVNSPWLGLMLDTGSYRQGDPYVEIAATAAYAVNWQIKEEAYVDGKVVPTDLPKLISIIKASGYRGYLPIETLGAGDPMVKVPAFLARLRTALENNRT